MVVELEFEDLGEGHCFQVNLTNVLSSFLHHSLKVTSSDVGLIELSDEGKGSLKTVDSRLQLNERMDTLRICKLLLETLNHCHELVSTHHKVAGFNLNEGTNRELLNSFTMVLVDIVN